MRVSLARISDASKARKHVQRFISVSTAKRRQSGRSCRKSGGYEGPRQAAATGAICRVFSGNGSGRQAAAAAAITASVAVVVLAVVLLAAVGRLESNDEAV